MSCTKRIGTWKTQLPDPFVRFKQSRRVFRIVPSNNIKDGSAIVDTPRQNPRNIHGIDQRYQTEPRNQTVSGFQPHEATIRCRVTSRTSGIRP